MHELRKGPQGMELAKVHHIQGCKGECSAPEACTSYGDSENPTGEAQTEWATRRNIKSCSNAGPTGEGKAL